MKTPMQSRHDGSTHATGRRRVEVEWDDPGPKHLDAPGEDVERAILAVLARSGAANIEIHRYEERGSWNLSIRPTTLAHADREE